MCSVIGGLSESIESQLSKQPPGKLGLIMRETTTSTVIWLTAPLGVSRYLLCMKFVDSDRKLSKSKFKFFFP